MPLAEIQKLFFRDCPRRLEGDKRLDGLAVNRIGNTDNACLQDFGMHVQNVFNFLWIDILSPANNQIFLTIGDIDIVIFVDPPDVTRMEPAVAQHRRCFFWLVPISLHHARAFDDNLARLAGGELLAFVVKYLDGIAFLIAFPDGAVLGRPPARDIAAVNRCGFAESIPFPDIVFVFFPPRAGHFQRHRRRAADTGFERTQIIRRSRGVIEDLDIHGRHAAKIRDFMLVDTFHGLFGIPATYHDQFTTRQKLEIQGENPIAVEQGKGDQRYPVAADAEYFAFLFLFFNLPAVLFMHSAPDGNTPGIQQNLIIISRHMRIPVVMGEHDAFRVSGGACGVDHHGGVVVIRLCNG